MPHTIKRTPQHLLGKECGVPKRKRDSGLGSQTGKDGTWGEGHRGGHSKGDSGKIYSPGRRNVFFFLLLMQCGDMNKKALKDSDLNNLKETGTIR